MGIWNLHQWLRDFSGSAKKNGKRRKRLNLPLTVQKLEDRVVPATFTWTGLGGDSLWSTDANWRDDNSQPRGPDGNDPTDVLVFGPTAGVGVRNTNNDLNNPVFSAITISASGYSLAGNRIRLGNQSVFGSGNIVVNGGSINNTISTDLELGGGGPGTRQFITVNAGSNLLIDGSISGTTGVELTKEGTGTLTLGNDNSGFTGAISINNNAGIVIITDANALGNQFSGTTVGSGATLQVSGLASPLQESLILNGLGIASEGALVNLSGNNVIAGPVLLDSNVAIGSLAGIMTITGVVSDSGSGRDLTKEGVGTVGLANANTYRGLTRVNNGVLQVSNNLGLGRDAFTTNPTVDPLGLGTVVNQTITKVGTLQLVFDPTNPNNAFGQTGLLIRDEALTLNGHGIVLGVDALGDRIFAGALNNLDGRNEYAAPITLGSAAPNGFNVVIGVEPGTLAGSQLLVSGVVSGVVATVPPNSPPISQLVKTRLGRLIFDAANTYTGDTLIDQGTLTIRDSQGLGATTGPGGRGVTGVNIGATLEYQVDGLVPDTNIDPDYDNDLDGISVLDPHGRDRGIDSITGVAKRLDVSEDIYLAGTGDNGAGSLRSRSGINRHLGEVNLDGSSGASATPVDFIEATISSIGVDADPTQLDNANYFTDDYSLNVVGLIDSDDRRTLLKVGTGHMMLRGDNSYLATTDIRQGWVTVQSANALGGYNVPRGETAQPLTLVRDGAALHVKSLTPAASDNFTLAENLILAGTGIVHPFSLINGQGALMNIGGTNIVAGDVQLNQTVGIGVEVVDVGTTSELTITGTTSDFSSFTVSSDSSGDENENSNIIETGAFSGVLELSFNHFFAPDMTRVYYPPRGQPGSTLLFDSGFVGTNGNVVTVQIPFGPGSSTQIEIVVNEGGTTPGTIWEYTARLFLIGTNGGIEKLGTKRLRLQGDGTYTGQTLISEGVITAQHDSALGAATTGTTVAAGGALEIDRGIAINNGGIAAGISMWGEALTISGTGNTSVTGSVIAPLTVMNGDHMWRGTVTLANDVNIDVQTDTRLNLFGNIDDAGSAFGAGFTKRGLGELTLNGVNSYAGITAVEQGVVTILNGSALGGTQGGTVVSFGASLQVQGNITVAGEALTLAGNGVATVPSTVPIRWFANGPAPIANGETPGNLDVSGRVTSVVIDPTDAQVIYISTAGGGAWRTENGGRTWLPLLDQIIGLNGLPISAQTLFAGSIALSLNTIAFNRNDIDIASDVNIDRRVIYVGTGEGNNSFDSYYGRGVLRSTDSGRSWEQIAPMAGLVNLFDRKAINKIVVDPNDSDIIYVAVGNPGNGTNPNNLGNSGIWRYNANNPVGVGAGMRWENLTVGKGNKAFTASNFMLTEFDNYTDVEVRINPANGSRLIVMSIGNANGTTVQPMGAGTMTITPSNSGGQFFRNGMYFSQDSGALWDDSGFNQQDDRGVNGGTVRFPTAGNVKIALGNQVQNFGDGTPDNFIAYASVSYPSLGFQTTDSAGRFGGTEGENGNQNLENRLKAIYRLNINWNPTLGRYDVGTWANIPATPPAPPTQPLANEYMSNIDPATGLNRGRGDFTNAIIADPNDVTGQTFYVGGVGQTLGRGVLRSTDGGASLTDIGIGVNGNGPHSYAHGFGFSAGGELHIATDGGVFSSPSPRAPAISWVERNGNLAITQFNSISTNPFNLTNAVGGSQSNGVDIYTGDATWMQTDNGNGGRVLFDPKNPLTVYSILERPGTTLLRRSSDGGATWQTLLTLSSPAPTPVRNGNVTPVPVQAFPLAIDSIVTTRILVGGPGGVRESLSQGNPGTFVNLNAPITASSIALATFQGIFVPDAGFPQVLDVGANTSVPGTIWITNGTQVAVTKNNGLTWQLRSTGLPTNIQEIIVDPRHRDVAYVVSSNFTGGRVFMTTDAGLTWTNITANLPTDLPVQSIVIDPRTGGAMTIDQATGRLVTDSPSGDLYIGTDLGVFVRRAGTPTWARFGTGLPNVQVKDLELNLSQNTLNAGTYGRSLFTYYLPDVAMAGGALRAVSGESVWTGNITLTGTTAVPNAPVSIGAAGRQDQADGAGRALINILGVISDQPGATHDINKIGGGTVVFSGSNTYAGQTTVRNGVLGANNLTALGGNPNPVAGETLGLGTSVQADTGFQAALELQSNLGNEPIALFGDGFMFNGHFAGALSIPINKDIVYTGVLSLATNSTIGVDSGSTFRMTSGITDGVNSFNLTKELTGTLILNGASDYGGRTDINQGALRATNSASLGAAPGALGTRILDGAQLQLAGSVNLIENIAVAGTGINSSGAIVNISESNTITGTLTISNLPALAGFSPTTVPPTQVAINVFGTNDTLTIDGTVNQTAQPAATPIGLNKIGGGRLTLNLDNSYAGTTNVVGGALRIRAANGLGTTASGTVVNNGAQLELEGNFTVGAESLSLTGTGTPLPLPRDAGTLTPTLEANGGALQAISGVIGFGGNVLLLTDTTVGGPGGELTLTGVVSDPTLSNLTKVGDNKIVLANDNTYRGLTTVNNGVLGISNPGALGDGTPGTLVNSGGTLQLSGGITVTTEDLTINGIGESGIGALDNLSGTNTWQRFITLGSNSSVGSTSGTLILDRPLTDGVSTFSVTKVGAATVSYAGTADNEYDGPTIVNNGTLLLNKTGGGVPFRSSLQVGDNFGTSASAELRLGQANQIPDGIVVTVNNDGLLNLAGFTEAIATTNVNDGAVTTGTNGVLLVAGLNMTGGTVTAATGGRVTLLLDATATSSATQTATINGPGILDLGGTNRTFTVVDGAQRVDLAVNAVIDDQLGEGLFKAGAGRMALNGTNTYDGVTSIDAGDLEVNGSLPATSTVTLNSLSASLSGTGTVGSVSGAPFATGSVNPGQNGTGGTTGILNTNSLTLGTNSTFNVTLNGVTPGSGHDQVFDSGVVSLGGATLSGTVGGAVNIGDQFTILQSSSPINGRFAEPSGPGVAFIGGRRFDVDYSDPNRVVLTLVQSGATVGVVSNVNPAGYGQQFSFIATVTPESGASGTPLTGTVTFTLNGPSGTLTQTVGLNANRQAGFNPIAANGGVALLPGTYSLDVNYNGDPNFNGAAGTLSPLQVVAPANTSTSVTATPSPSNFGSPVTITAVVAGQFGSPVPQGTVNFSVNGGAAISVTLVNGRASFTTSNLPRGTSSITATYIGNDPSGGFNASTRTMTTSVNPGGTLPPPNPGDPLPPPAPRADPLQKTLVAFGAEGGGSHARVVDTATGREVLSIFAYNPLYTGGVRVALGDVNGDGVFDLITGTGVGGGPHVKVFDGTNGAEIRSFFAYAPNFTGGLYVASGDVNNDGFSDIITGAGPGAGPHVKVFDGRSGQEISSFFAYIPNFLGGVNVAAGDVDGDGFSDIITGAAAISTHVKVFSGRTGQEVQSFFAFNEFVTGGVSVATGDINGDGLADIITAPGSGGPHVRAFKGNDLTELASFFAFDAPVPNGIRVAAVDTNRNGRSEIVVGQGFGGRVRRIDPITQAVLDDSLPYNVTPIGVFVG